MALPPIFCPQCNQLILAAKQCPACRWQRPLATSKAGKPNWAVALEVKLPSKESHLVAANGLVYVPTHNGQIVALDTNAEPEDAVIWRYQLDPHYYCYSVTAWKQFFLPGNEYLGGYPTPDGTLTLLSAETGEKVWSYPIEGTSVSVPVIRNNSAFFATNTGWLYEVDLGARKEMWRHKIESPWSWSPAAPLLATDNLLILPGRSGQLAAFDLEKREISWTFEAEAWFPHTPGQRDQVIYTRCWDKHVYAIDAVTGRELWRHRADRDYSSDLWVGEKHIFIGAKDYRDSADRRSRAYALYLLSRQTGERVGRYEVKGHILARPIATAEAVFFATDDRSREIESQGTLYALNIRDPHNPVLLWEEPCVVEQRFQSDLLLVGDHIVTGTRQGAIYAVRWREVETTVETPSFYQKQEQWEDAAIAHALLGQYTQAANIYARQLDQPLSAGQLYLHAGDNQAVIALLGQSTHEAEQKLAREAAAALPTAPERAEAFCKLGDNLAAAAIYADIEDWAAAAQCYEAAQALAEARDAYQRAGNSQKWRDLSRKLEEWHELTEHYIAESQHAKAAEIYKQELGMWLKAAESYEQAGLPAEALVAYRQVSPEKMTPETNKRLAILAEEAGDLKLAIDTYRAIGDVNKAAELAETSGLYQQALAFYQELGRPLKVAETLEKLGRFLDASELLEKRNFWGRAAENLEQQVEMLIGRAGGLRSIGDDREKLEAWLTRAIELFEAEIEEADPASDTAGCEDCIDRIQQKLARLRKEPLLSVSFYTDSLAVHQSCVVKYKVKNVGWGIARNVRLVVKSAQLQHEDLLLSLGDLRPGKDVTDVFAITPNIPGAIMLHVEFQSQTKSGGLTEIPLEGAHDVVLETQADAVVESAPGGRLSNWWQVGSTGSSSGADDEVVSQSSLNKQISRHSLKQQLAQHYANLHKLEEDKAIYGLGEVPVHIHNKLEAEKQIIAEIKERLENFE